MPSPIPRLLIPLAVLSTLTACAASPGPPPAISLAGRSCVAAADLAAAKPVTLDAGKTVEVNLDDHAACLEPPGGPKSAYAAFQLPLSAEPYLVTVLSTPIGQGLFAPRLLVLDAQGATIREIPKDSFTFHGAVLHAAIRAHADERYLIVASDPASVGQTVSQLSEATQSTLLCGPMLCSAYHSGSETSNTLTFAHNGSITVSAQPVPKLN